MKTCHARTRRAEGFSLMELLVVITIIGLLSALTMGAFRYAQQASARNRTMAMAKGIESGLTSYNAEWGEYPQPANEDDQDTFNGMSFNVGGAKMLYQALTGDGSSEIKLAAGGGNASDGQWDDDEKLIFKEMPMEMYMISSGGARVNRYMLVDGFYQPFQYTKGGTPEAVNPTFDLWSFGNVEAAKSDLTDVQDKQAKLDSKTTAKWIKNF